MKKRNGKWSGCRSVRWAALEGPEHQIAHGADILLDPLQPIGISVAVFGALAVVAVALLAEFAVGSDQHGIIGKLLCAWTYNGSQAVASTSSKMSSVGIMALTSTTVETGGSLGKKVLRTAL